MNFVSIVKRVAPFFLTFAVGLFIASFFVTVAAPSFQFNRGFSKHRQYHRRIEAENQRLREENLYLRNRVTEMEKRDWVFEEAPTSIPSLPAAPEAPAVPVVPMKTVPYKSR
jgi:hypothetical protein